MGKRILGRKPRHPQFRTNLGMNDPELGDRPDALAEHRELEYLRAVGHGRGDSKKRGRLLDELGGS